MNFIRNNMFLVICVAVALVAIGVLVFWNMGIEEDVEGVVNQRDALAKKIERLSRKPYANEKTIQMEVKKNTRILEQVAKVRQKNDEFNSATFNMIQVTLPEGGMIPALPYDAQLWKSKSLGYRYIEAYHKALDELLISLTPTRPGTEKDVEEKAVGIQERLETERLIRERNERAAAGGAAVDRAGAVRDRSPDMPTEILGVDGGRGGARTTSEEAKKEAFDVVRVQQAGRGVVFATTDVFDVMFPRGVLVSSVTPQEVFDSWVSYSIQADVIRAINATNEQAFEARKVPEGNRNVTTAAIKRLYGIQVQQREVRKAPAYDAGPHPSAPVGPMGMGVAESAVNTLTGAKTDEMGNVVQYTFSILMRTSELPRLEKSLIKANYHVILNEDITLSFEPGLMSFARADIARGARATGPGAQPKDESYYYYGTEPARVVTLQVEVRLLSGWLRGAWNQKDNKWGIEPLMPIEVLKELPVSALRPVDRKRVDGALGQTGPIGVPSRRGPQR